MKNWRKLDISSRIKGVIMYFSTDPLYPCYKHENGFMLETFFELKNEDGIWIKSKDPR